jgi:hypothetical protein
MAASFAHEKPQYDGLPGRVVTEWLRRHIAVDIDEARR